MSDYKMHFHHQVCSIKKTICNQTYQRLWSKVHLGKTSHFPVKTIIKRCGIARNPHFGLDSVAAAKITFTQNQGENHLPILSYSGYMVLSFPNNNFLLIAVNKLYGIESIPQTRGDSLNGTPTATRDCVLSIE